MSLLKLYHQAHDHSVIYKAVDESTITLTPQEEELVIKKAILEKIGRINSENYLKALNYKPSYKIPSFEELHEGLINELKEFYGWTIDKWNTGVIQRLCYYFSNDLIFETLGEGYSLSKGILIPGPVGCGKTTLLKILSKNTFNPYMMESAREIADKYAQDGIAAIRIYSSLRPVDPTQWLGNTHIGLCIDDIGTEQNKKNFGNELNVISEIILNRYDKADSIGKTHVTTNIAAEDIKDYYGVRAASRMRQMFNIIDFPFDAPDRRK